MKDMDGKKRENYECFKNNRERERVVHPEKSNGQNKESRKYLTRSTK
jgi:hypothetical protein